MTIEEALEKACAQVGIVPPRTRAEGRWIKTDTLSGKNGKGDGRVILDGRHVTACNWQTGETETVWIDRAFTPAERQQYAEQKRDEEKQRRGRAKAAAAVAQRLVEAAAPTTHPYLADKGFPDEQVLVVQADAVRAIGGEYLVAPGGQAALVMPARIGPRLTSVQLIWENGTKKFLAGGEISGAYHRIGKGAYTWLCEGLATGLSLRSALRGLKMQATVLCCFSASNVAAVAPQVQGRAFVAADHDKPLAHAPFNGLGTGEFYAIQTGLPYGMPPVVRTDFNDMHQQAGIFAVQRTLTAILAGRRAA